MASRLRSKELVVGILFTAGCALPTFTRLQGWSGDGVPVVLLVLAAGLFAALGWLNCTAIDRWESPGVANIARPAWFIALGAIALTLVCAPFAPRLAALSTACAISALLLRMFDRKRFLLTPLAMRCVADLVLLTPIVCLVR